jgi:hypothetical protein
MEDSRLTTSVQEKKLLSVRETADYWGLSPKVIRQKCLQGLIPEAFKPPGSHLWRIPIEAIKEFEPGSSPSASTVPPRSTLTEPGSFK